jgi:ribosomal protein S8
MPQTLPVNLCSHLLNTSRAALARTSLPYTQSNLAITSLLLRHGLISSLTLGTPTHPSPTDFNDLPPPARRLWVGLKHRNGNPVLRYMNLVSKPSVRIHVTRDELGRLLSGKRAKNVPAVGMGEVLVVKVSSDSAVGRTGKNTYMEGWEAWRAGLGGEIVCRAG